MYIVQVSLRGRSRRCLAGLACAVLLAGLSGCNAHSAADDQAVTDGMPANVIAQVGEVVITRAQVERALGPRPEGVPSDDPQRAERARQTAGDLIQSAWLERAARAAGVRVSSHKVEQAARGQTVEPFVRTTYARAGLLRARLTQRISGGAVTPSAVKDYYQRHRNSLRSPGSRLVQVLVTESQAKGEAAKRQLEGGRSWKTAIAALAVDVNTPLSPVTGPTPLSGKQGTVEGEWGSALDKLVFTAPRGSIAGPVNENGWWYLIEVLVDSPGRALTLREAKPTILSTLEGQRQQRAAQQLAERLQDKYRRITRCREALNLTVCRNGPRGPVNLTV